MKSNITKALIAIGLGLALNGFGQKSEVLYTQDFENDNYPVSANGCCMGESRSFIDKNDQIFNNSSFLNISVYSTRDLLSYPDSRSELTYHGIIDKITNYDSIEAEFLMEVPASYFVNSQYKFNITEAGFHLEKNRVVPVTDSTTTTVLIILSVTAPDGAKFSYNPITKVARVKWSQENLPRNVRDFKNYLPILEASIHEHIFLLNNCDANCVMKYFIPQEESINFAIDNLTIKGISTVTGLDQEDHISMPDKKIFKAVDILGRDIVDLKSFEGTAIVLYQDGSREKVVR